jgi:hypothetical protein
MMTQPLRTNWANTNNPFTGKVLIKEVPVPKVVMPRKGHTKYDTEFEKLLEFKSGIESTENGFEVLRRAMQRFLEYRNLKETISVRRQINKQTRMVTLWLEPKQKK